MIDHAHAQEFLRRTLDVLHEELASDIPPLDTDLPGNSTGGGGGGGRRGGKRKTGAKSQTRTIGRERPSESPVLSWIYLPGRWFLRSSAVFAERCVLNGAREALICPSHARRVSALVLMRMRARSNLFTNVGISMRYGDLAHSSSCVGRSLAAEVRLRVSLCHREACSRSIGIYL